MPEENRNYWRSIVELCGAFATLILFARDMLEKKYFTAALILLILAALVSGYYASSRLRERLAYTMRSIPDYIPQFKVERNQDVWNRAKSEYRYLGVSAGTMKALLVPWLSQQSRGDKRRFRLLLLDPNGSALPRQICNELNIAAPPEDPKNEYFTKLHDLKANIQAGLASIRGTEQFKSKLLEVRLYDDYSSWWMHIVDDQDLYLGLLEEGKPGINGPVIVFRNVLGQFTLFNSFLEHWERLWDSAKHVS